MAKHPTVREATHPTIIVPAHQTPQHAVTRRGMLKAGFWTGIGALLLSIPATVINTLWPRQVEAFGGPVTVPRAFVPKPGDPPARNFAGHFLLVNLQADEGRLAADETASEGGLLALWWKCPHLGCTVPWEEQFVAPADKLRRRGWFRCPCHASTYSKAGVRVSGPAPRSMDTMQLSTDAAGNLVVQTGERTPGSTDNPRRALPWPPQP